MILEVCVDNADGLLQAQAGGADRIELCSALPLGGLTPSSGLIHFAAQANIACYAMIRPHGGDFVFQKKDLDVMAHDIATVRAAGLNGVVLGASLPDGRLDEKALRFLCLQADGIGKTLHRAFDLVPDLAEAVELAIELGFERILTSGRATRAIDGLEDLARVLEIAAGRIVIMPGSGILADNAAALLAKVGTTEIHASCSSDAHISLAQVVDLGFSPAVLRQTDANKVRALKRAMEAC